MMLSFTNLQINSVCMIAPPIWCMTLRLYTALEDDILELHFSDNPIVKETTQDWNIVLSYDANNHLVQMVVLEASASGLLPLQERQAA